jgi:O-antigen/teichoic acid export membrane protein
MGQLRFFAFAALGEAAINLVLSLLLVQSLGIVGIAWASALPNLLFCLFVIGFTCRTLGIGWRVYLRETWLRPVLCAIVPMAVWIGGWSVGGWGSLALAIGAGLLPYALAVVAAEHVRLTAKRDPFESTPIIPALSLPG